MNPRTFLFSLANAALLSEFLGGSLFAANPIVTNVFTADPAAMVYKDTVYPYTLHDVPPDKV